MRIVFTRWLAAMITVIVLAIIGSWTFLVYAGKIPPQLPQWSVPVTGVGGLGIGLLIPLVKWLRDHGIKFEFAWSDSIPPPKE